MDETNDRSINETDEEPRICGKLPKKELIYFFQIIAIYIIIIACIVNLSVGTDKDSLWASLLSGSLGYLLPNPKIQKKKDESIFPDVGQ